MNHDIISKVSKLLELAKSSNIHEATAAAIAADKLIAKFRISEEDLANHQAEPIEQDNSYIYESARAITWKVNLAIHLAEHYSCYIYNNIGFNAKGRQITRLRLVGVKSDIEIAKYLFTWLVFKIEGLNKNNKGLGHIVANSFCLGAAAGVQEQLVQSKKENQEEAIKNGQEAALQRLDQRYSAAESLARTEEKLKDSNKKTKNYISNEAYKNGVNAGKNIHLGKAVDGAKVKLLKS